MKKAFLHIILLYATTSLLAQNNALILNNDPYVVFNGGSSATPIYMVINQPHQNGIITQGTGGNIISEDEYNYVKWNIGTSTGNFTVPFTTGVGTTEAKIPLTVTPTTAGVGAGDILFSTYESDDDNLPWPTDVTHFMSSTGNIDNKAWVVDRFWIIDAENYSTRPAVSLNFGFNNDATEVGTAANTLNPANLGAQRFNNTNNRWEGSHSGSYGIWGNTAGPAANPSTAGNNRVENVNILASEFYRSWTLTDYDHPLPLSLVYFKGDCNNSDIILEWEIQTQNTTNYIVQKSTDGVNFFTIGNVNSYNGETQFQFIDRNPYIDISYYRILTNETNVELYSSIISVSSCESESSTYIFSPLNSNTIHIELNAQTNNSIHSFNLIDMSGKLIQQESLISSNKGQNQFIINSTNIATGIYNVILTDDNGNKTVKKIIL